MDVGRGINRLIACAALMAMAFGASDHLTNRLWAQDAQTQVQPASYGWLGNGGVGRVTDANCENNRGACDKCGKDPCACCSPLWQHRTGAFADFLYLRPGNVDVVYAVEQTSFDPALASPTGPVGRVGIDGGAGFRIGGNWAMDDCTSLVATYTWLQSDTEDTITAAPGTVLDLAVGHPSVVSSGATSISAFSTYEIDYQFLDLDYNALLWGTCNSAINYVVGLRYGHLDQDFVAQQEIFSAAGLTTVGTEIDFDGFGIRGGLEGMKRNARTGVLLYGKAYANFIGGEFKANFEQANQFGGTAIIRNELEDYRLVTVLEAELGVGWESSGGRVRVTSGYAVSGWFNTLTTGSYIDGVQAGSYNDLGETLTFDGFVTRLELRY
jgi:hypothetical protein